jgi:hypothetical protein
MRKHGLCVTVAFGAWVVAAPHAASLAGAAEVSLSDLVLKKTYLKAAPDADAVGLSGWRNVFSPTSITCPGTDGTCTARITLSVDLSTFDKGEAGRVVCRVIRISLVFPNPPPLPGLIAHHFGDDSGRFQANVLTVSWIARSLPIGAHAFSVQCATVVSPDSVGGPVRAGARTLTVDVYKP